MAEYGRFKQGETTFYGVVQAGQVTPLTEAPWHGGRPTGAPCDLDDLVILVPCEPTKLIAIGHNYREHAAERQAPAPEVPLLWLKAPSSLTPHRSMVAVPFPEHRTDYEAELALVIGSVTRRAKRENALAHVFGYTSAQDISDRTVQAADGQWARAKSYDTFTPLGPTIRTGWSPAGARVRQYHNGVLKQDGGVEDMIFDLATLVAFVSDAMTLNPGDVILTGTPAGVGPIQPGDHLEVQITGLAALANNVGMRGSA
jgi:2-keto-4-pentenoate hydratase/2-oxohepta-3-ene-1,7-dioic acid hydratase in catechol pathway